MTVRRRLLLALLLLLVSCAAAQVNYNQRDDKYRVLGLKRAKEVYESTRRDYDRQQEMFSRHLISQAELDRAHAQFSDAEVNYQQSLLAVLFEQQFVSVARAVKYQGKDGGKFVRLTIAKTSGVTAEFQKLLNIDDNLFRSLQPDIVNNVYVSILNSEGAIISQPYETKIPELRNGQPQTLNFALLQDLDAVTVNLIFANGSTRSMKIFLQKDAAVNRVAVQSEQFSQEVELGKSASFDLTLELFSGVTNTFSLEVVNLPPQINRFFKDPAGQARLSQFKFTQSTNTRKAALEVALPDRPAQDVVMDKAITFYVLVLPVEQRKRLGDLSAKVWTLQEIEALNAGYARLEVIPRGQGKLLVRSPQLFQSISPGGSVSMAVDVVNEGSRRLDNVEIKVDPPLNWTKTIDPSVVPVLDIGQEHRITLGFTPPPGIAPGRYEVRLRTSALSETTPINAEDKTVTVEVLSETSILGTALLVIVILGLIGGVVYFGIRLSKR